LNDRELECNTHSIIFMIYGNHILQIRLIRKNSWNYQLSNDGSMTSLRTEINILVIKNFTKSILTLISTTC